MLRGKADRSWVEIVFLSLLSVLFYQFAIGLFVFLVPLQVIYQRRGKRFFLISLALTFALFAGIRLIRPFAETGTTGAGVFALTELFAIGCLMGGLALLNLWQHPLGNVFKLLAAAAAAGLASIPVILSLSGNTVFAENIDALFTVVSSYLTSAFSQNPAVQSPLLTQAFQPESLKRMAADLFYKSYLFGYFLILTSSWWAGTLLGAKAARKEPGIAKLVAFKMREQYLWIFIAVWAVVLATSPAGSRIPLFLNAAAWNIGLTLLLLYGLQGIGILRHFMAKYNLPRGARILSMVVLAVLLLSPRINVVFFFLIPGLGISETWIKYRD